MEAAGVARCLFRGGSCHRMSPQLIRPLAMVCGVELAHVVLPAAKRWMSNFPISNLCLFETNFIFSFIFSQDRAAPSGGRQERLTLNGLCGSLCWVFGMKRTGVSTLGCSSSSLH